MKNARWVAVIALIGLAFSLSGCGSSPERLKTQLEEIAASDLRDILAELEGKKISHLALPNPYFVVDEYQEFTGDTARVFQAYASVYFMYLDSIRLCQNRKYRYRTTSRIWDRYEISLIHIPDSLARRNSPSSGSGAASGERRKGS